MWKQNLATFVSPMEHKRRAREKAPDARGLSTSTQSPPLPPAAPARRSVSASMRASRVVL